ncbi:hypothetical protein CEXT_461491 [Caerostris extrusa]|uniref:Uncharacterized protein n=1 Tax=Caerostris extrusa TaxID=172846 RepID=A0AAV4N079_CAEEX|nr:hypothetical protein CEXT_461491 [Caerostris extrusa]
MTNTKIHISYDEKRWSRHGLKHHYPLKPHPKKPGSFNIPKQIKLIILIRICQRIFYYLLVRDDPRLWRGEKHPPVSDVRHLIKLADESGIRLPISRGVKVNSTL